MFQQHLKYFHLASQVELAAKLVWHVSWCHGHLIHFVDFWLHNSLPASPRVLLWCVFHTAALVVFMKHVYDQFTFLFKMLPRTPLPLRRKSHICPGCSLLVYVLLLLWIFSSVASYAFTDLNHMLQILIYSSWLTVVWILLENLLWLFQLNLGVLSGAGRSLVLLLFSC